MKKFKLTKREYIVAGVLVLAGIYAFTGVVVTTALVGGIGGIIIGANLPASWRAKLMMVGRKAQAPPTITVPPAPYPAEASRPPVPGERRDDIYGGGS